MTVWADLLAILRAENEILSSLLALGEENRRRSTMRMRLSVSPVTNRSLLTALQ